MPLPLLLALALAAGPDAAAGKKAGETFQDCADCQKMVVIPAGSFKMGSTPRGARPRGRAQGVRRP